MALDPLPEVWAGAECSFLDVASGRCDQLALTGHDRRADDIDRLAALGARAVRYPVLWGRGTGRAHTNWAWAEARLTRLRELGIRPIVGFLHHGQGRAPADLLAPDFPERFGAYAARVAARFPEIDGYLPLNEPLTTARFAGLYGLWPPYARDDRVFVRLLLNQCLAIRAAFRAIRRINPNAELFVNEDVGRTVGTAAVAAQVAFQNERRWLAFDLLTGRVDRDHPLWAFLAAVPGTRATLDVLAQDPEPPDVLGIDYYVTSDRFLDHRVAMYPPHIRGGNGRIEYADVELVRIRGARMEGFGGAIRETWNRYRLPAVLAEVQLAGAPRDQIAWWIEAWRAAVAARARGVDVRAVTAWAVFGAWEWNSLLCRKEGYYEPGAYDIRFHPPALTPLGELLARMRLDTAAVQTFAAGWWRRPDRALYPRTPLEVDWPAA